MIKKITKLENFGIFSPITPQSGAPDFNRYNLIYGWNRSGKTTLSRIFFALSERDFGFPNYPKGGKFTIELGDGSTVDQERPGFSDLTLKVFNQDFVDKYLSFKSLGNHCDVIVYLSKEDKKLIRDLEEKKNDHANKMKDHDQLLDDRDRTSSQLDSLRRSMAADIKRHTRKEESRSDNYYNYNKGSVQRALENYDISEADLLSGDDFRNYQNTIANSAKDSVSILNDYMLKVQYEENTLTSIEEIVGTYKNLCSTIIQNELIERLKEDRHLNKWVKEGFQLHKDLQEDKRCLFCTNLLPSQILDRYAKHFNERYQKFIEQINSFIIGLNSIKVEVQQQEQDIYPNFEIEYKDAKIDFATSSQELNNSIDKMINVLEMKKDTPFEVLDRHTDLAERYSIVTNAGTRLRDIQRQHNEFAQNHLKRILGVKQQLELHLLYLLTRDNNYFESRKKLQKIEGDIAIVNEELKSLNREIEAYEQETSSIAGALPDINKRLEGFFGQAEIQLKLSTDRKGYMVLQNGTSAKSLSEGEKTAIAFSYFLSKVYEKGAEVKHSIIFIDDPISSLDSNYIIYCYSLIKTYFEQAAQLFISTHNFEFLGHLKHWLGNDHKKAKAEFFMVQNTTLDNIRRAQLVAMESTIRDFQSEYQYLFYLLNKCLDETPEKQDTLYMIGNVARRFLEIYCNFKIPKTSTLEEKIQSLRDRAKSFTDEQRTRLFKLTNVYSHPVDPLSLPSHTAISEVKPAIQDLFKLIQITDRRHYNALLKAIAPKKRPTKTC